MEETNEIQIEEVTKPEKKKRNWFVIGAGILVVFIIIILMTNSTKIEPVDDSNIMSIEDLAREESIDARLRETYQPDRDSYGLGTYRGGQFRIVDMFKNLEPLPDDFYKYKYLLMTGKMNAAMLCNLEAKYYMQPEFFRNSFLESGLNIYRNPSMTHWTPEGYGTYPHEMEVLVSPGASVDLCTIFHSSWGVETYQGFSLIPMYPGSASLGGVTKNIDVANSKKYIDVKIEPENVLIGPAYILFDPSWTQKVTMTITVAPDTPVGVYAVGFDVGRLPLAQAEAWLLEYGEKFQTKSNIQISEPQFKVVVQVR